MLFKFILKNIRIFVLCFRKEERALLFMNLRVDEAKLTRDIHNISFLWMFLKGVVFEMFYTV